MIPTLASNGRLTRLADALVHTDALGRVAPSQRTAP